MVARQHTERIPAAERRESMLAAASIVFGERGYAGATTDQIAAAAGISQAYVVRTFGSKENLFIEVARRATARITATFEEAIADTGSEHSVIKRLGDAYIDLVADRGILLSLLHFFSLGHDPVIGPVGREGFLAIYRLVRDGAGLSPAAATEFLAQGMLINTALALQLHDADDSDATELLTEVCGDDVSRFRTLAGS